MRRTIAVVCVMAALAGSALADQIELLDGRTFEGLVTIDGDTVTVKMTYGTLQFTQREVARIVYKDTPEEVLAKKLDAASADSAADLFAVAKWALDNALDRQGKELLAKVIALDADHAEARRTLLHARIDGKWYAFDRAIELARGKLEAGRHENLLGKVIPALKALPLSSAQRADVDVIFARTHMCAGRFTDAKAVFSDLADRVGGQRAIQYAAIVQILTEHDDGMYVVSRIYPPRAALVPTKEASLGVGPVSLSRPIALDAALHDMATRTELDAGKTLLGEARKVEPTDPDAAKTKYALATLRFQRADAIVVGTRTPGISRAWHIEIARRRISGIRKLVDADAKECDKIEQELGRATMSKKEYRAVLLKMMRHLGEARDGLKDILELAKPYPRALVLEVKWAEVDLKKIEGWRKVLTAELDNGK